MNEHDRFMLIGLSNYPVDSCTICYLLREGSSREITVPVTLLNQYNVINAHLINNSDIVLTGGKITNLPLRSEDNLVRRNENYNVLLYRLENNGKIEGYRIADSHGRLRDIRVESLEHLGANKFVNARVNSRLGATFLVSMGAIFKPLIKGESKLKHSKQPVIAVSDTIFKIGQAGSVKVCGGFLDNVSESAISNKSIAIRGINYLPVTMGVNYIGKNAFNKGFDDKLINLILPDTVKVIGSGAFCSDKQYFEHIILREGIKEIGDFAFCSRYFKSLKISGLPQKLNHIGVRAFYGVDFTAKGIKKLRIESKVIQSGAFTFSKLPPYVIIGGGTKSIESGAFSGIANLESIKCFSIEEGVRRILYSPLPDILGNSYTSTIDVGSASVYIPKSVNHIDNGAIRASMIYGYCDSEAERYAKEMNIPFKCIFKCIPVASSNPQKCRIKPDAEISCYKSPDLLLSGVIEIPSEMNGYDIIGIADGAFRNTDISEVVISSVSYIGEEAFYGCSNLSRVRVNCIFDDIGRSAFEQSGLKELKISDSEMMKLCIHERAFAECDIRKISLPEHLKYLDVDAFANSKVERMKIAWDSCYSAGMFGITYDIRNTRGGVNCVIHSCPYNLLSELSIPDWISGMLSGALRGKTCLKKVIIPSSFTEIPSEAFSGCTSLESVSIPDSVSAIGENAFFGCKSLRTVSVPDSVTEIKRGTFLACDSLKELEIGEFTSLDPLSVSQNTVVKRRRKSV